jgi:hypothetical protein
VLGSSTCSGQGDKYTSQNVILELSSDRQNFYSFTRMSPETVEDLMERVHTGLNDEKDYRLFSERRCLLQRDYINTQFIKTKYYLRIL